MVDFSITKTGPEDAEALLGMVQALAAHHGDVARASTASLARDLSDGWLIGLIARGSDGVDGAMSKPLGYALLMPHAQAQYGLRGMDLHHLFVHPEARAHGVGRALIEAAEGYAKDHGASYMVIGANDANHRAQAFYGALGYARKPASGQRFRKAFT